MINDGVPTTPIALLTHLGALSTPAGPKSLDSLVENLYQRKSGFEWAHLGNLDLPIHKLFTIIRSHPWLVPPRTGHLGNWTDIAAGRAGMMDYNTACIQGALGYPLLYCFTQTEDVTLQRGDCVYLPGSIIENGHRTELSLFTWDGTSFAERPREHPLFTPFVQTRVDGELVPLSLVHWKRMQLLPGFEFRLEASVVRGNEPLVRDLLGGLIEDARQQSNQYSAFQDILSHLVGLDGTMYRCPVEYDGRGYRMGMASYPNTTALVEAAMLPFLAATEPETFFSNVRELPSHVPKVSNLIARLFSAFLCTHYPKCKINRTLMTQPFNPHLHWGGVGMAGYPPKKGGYLSSKATVRSARKICNTVIARFPEIDPVFFVLLPTVILSLLTPKAHKQDLKLLSVLIDRVKRVAQPLAGRPDLMEKALDGVVREWVIQCLGELSPYFLHRFSGRHSVLNTCPLPEPSQLVEPDGFDSLTVRQASMTVGALIEALTAVSRV